MTLTDSLTFGLTFDLTSSLTGAVVTGDQVMVTGQLDFGGVKTTGFIGSIFIGSLNPATMTFTQGEVSCTGLYHIDSFPERIVIMVTTSVETDEGFINCTPNGTGLIRGDADTFAWSDGVATWEWFESTTGFGNIFMPIGNIIGIDYAI